jgi:hypothetical protein
MDRIARYQEEAKRARQQAAAAGSHEDRKAWLQVAESWDALAKAQDQDVAGQSSWRNDDLNFGQDGA